MLIFVKITKMTPRQKKILSAIISEFTNNAEAVGSLAVSQKYNLGVSPATIRNEMADLVDQGYIKMSHSSSGRIPTSLGFRFYIDEIMDEEDLSYMEELEMNKRIFQARFAKERLVKQSVDVAAEVTRCLAVALLNDVLFYAGVSDLIRYHEFQNIEELQNLLGVLENYQIMSNVFSRARGDSDRSVKILIGEETGVNTMDQCGVVFKDFKVHSDEKGVFAIIGPARMNYRKIVPVVNFVTEKLNNATFGW